jgi:2-polyprenyl-3-methyl-5-hydroxy-6-metoxy-1,4-benzoquinol methylase
MPMADAVRWNNRYRYEDYGRYRNPRPFLVRHAHLLPSSGWALDIAMGMGANAGYLAGRGLQVVGVDISDIAVRYAKSTHPDLHAVIADLTDLSFLTGPFDVILNFYFLQRSLWPQMAGLLNPGGLLIFETLTAGMLEIKPGLDPVYLLKPGELSNAFREFEVLAYREGLEPAQNGSPKATASLIGRRN